MNFMGGGPRLQSRTTSPADASYQRTCTAEKLQRIIPKMCLISSLVTTYRKTRNTIALAISTAYILIRRKTSGFRLTDQLSVLSDSGGSDDLAKISTHDSGIGRVDLPHPLHRATVVRMVLVCECSILDRLDALWGVRTSAL
jgi:hypothetical protein